MRRNMDLVRIIMFNAENDYFGDEIDGYSTKEVLFHQKLLIDAGFLNGKSYNNTESAQPEVAAVIIREITWEGYNFLDIIKDDNKFKILKDLGKNLSLEVFKTGMKLIIQNSLT